jgi:hypothetical protein
MAFKKWFKRLGSSEGGSNNRSSNSRKRDERASNSQPQQPAVDQSIYDDEDDEDYDQPIHDFEQAQEDYLMSVALATSASEYEYAAKQQTDPQDTGFAMKAPPVVSLAHRAEALAHKYWSSGRWVWTLLCHQ